MRLNIYLQQAGVGSRREAERMVEAGRVTVNGQKALVTTPVEEGDKVAVDGKTVSAATRDLPRLFMLNKPLDVLCTTYDSQGRDIVFDLPSLRDPKLPRLMLVGRLDVNSEGLLLLSDDGPLAQTLMHPATALERQYRVRVHGRLTEVMIDKLADGVTIDGIAYRGAKVVEEKEPSGKNTWYRITLTEGKNREIRRLMEYFECVVNRLVRTDYGPFKLGDLTSGQLREVPAKRVEALIDELKQRGAKL